MAKETRIINVISIFVIAYFISACGVKSSPLPPETMPPIGDGRPAYFSKKRDHLQPQPRFVDDKESSEEEETKDEQ